MDRYRLKAALKTIGYTILWFGIILFTTRQSVLTIKEIQPQPQQQVEAAPVVQEVPDAAKTTVRKFLIHWLYASGEESTTDKIKRLEKYSTSGLVDRLKQKPNLLLTVESSKKRETVQANSIDPWKAEWVKEEEGKRAMITYNVVLQDGRDVYMKVPVVQTGSWAVEGLPALVPGEKRKERPEPEMTSVPESKEVEAVVDGFFSAWLAGKTEAISRYTKVDLPTADALEKLQGQYEGVTVEGLSVSPLKVKAIVTVQDAYGQTLSFEYRLTMKKADGQWYITGME